MSNFDLFKKKIIKDPEPEPLKKKKQGAGAAKKITGPSALKEPLTYGPASNNSGDVGDKYLDAPLSKRDLDRVL